MTPIPPELLEVAAGQHGMLTTAQAKAAGVSSRALAGLVRAATLIHPGRGLYAVPDLVDEAPEPWHRHLCAGALLLYDDAVLTSSSALHAQGLPVWGASLVRPQLLRPIDRVAAVKCFSVRPYRTEEQPSIPSDIGPTVPITEAVIQHTLDVGIVPGVVSADAALREGRTTREELQAAYEAVAAWPGASRVRSALTFVDGRRESVGESRCGVQLAMGSIDVTPQVRICDPRTGELFARVDFLVDRTKVVVEFDGQMKYVDPESLWAEKRREDRLRELGYVVVRIVWADLERSGAVVAKVRRALAQAHDRAAG